MTSGIVEIRDGLKLVQVIGGFVEFYFDWNKLPQLDLSKSYYCIEASPESRLLPIEYARPNSAGPLFLYLPETVHYRIDLLSLSHLQYTVESELADLPWVDLVSQHENLQKLVWANIDFKTLVKEQTVPKVEIWADDHLLGSQSINQEPYFEVRGRPQRITLKLSQGPELFTAHTNLAEREIVRSLAVTIGKIPTKLVFSTVISPQGGWRLRAELNPTFQMRKIWQRFYSKRFPQADPAKIVGSFRMLNQEKIVSTVRQFGYWTRIRSSVIDSIQIDEWKLKQRQPVRKYKLQLQITSAHRELYRFVLFEKQYPASTDLQFVGLSEEEIQAAEVSLSQVNKRISWDQAHLELVLWFRSDENHWHEFQRENAHNLRWDFYPASTHQQCRCEWVLTNIEDTNQTVIVLKSGSEKRPQWPARVLLQPYAANRLVALWDLDQQQTEQLILSRWKVDLNEVGFHLKVHEEFLGNRTHRSDLDVHIPELFSSHQNIYFDVDPDKCYSAEVVARHCQSEMALTTVSRSIVTPRIEPKYGIVPVYRKQTDSWFHSTQREVRHLTGKDSANKAKVLLHLHCHSPNLFRADPFREFFLKDISWPIKTMQGTEVHNPPGEWIAKNCMDSWLPLLRIFRKLAYEQVDFQISLDISPPAAYVLASPRFKDYMSRYLLRVQRYIRAQLALIKSRDDDSAYVYAAERYLEDIRALDLFYNHEINKDVLGAYRELEHRGYLEISTCTATHGMPAELANMPDLLKSQVTLAARSHHRLFGARPHGIWLAENSFFPGIEALLAAEKLNYFFIESESVLLGSHCPPEEEFNPVIIPNSDVSAFPRSRLGRMQVWDADLGYAGHPDFREYHFRHLGLPLKRITSKTSNEKQPYNPDQGQKVARQLAWDFYNKLCEKAHELGQRQFKNMPLITCSYDAELFGHHWSEGPIFLEELIREFSRKGDTVGLTTPSHYLIDSTNLPENVPNPSTWGHDAVHIRWSDPKVIWTYKELARAEGVLNQYLGKALNGSLEPWQKEMVEQMAAELIRAQSSDLTFVIISGDFEEDMRREILKYFDYFYKLKHFIDNGIENQDFMIFRKYENDMFPEIPGFYNIQ